MQIRCSICQRIVEVGQGEDPAKFQCSFCKQMFKSKNRIAGEQKNAAAAGEKIITQCPHCQKQFKMYAAAAGRDIKCLNCGKEFTVRQCEAKEQNDVRISPEHQADSVNQTIDEYSGRLDRRKREWALVSSSLVWLFFAGLAFLALTADVIRRTQLVSPNSGKCIKCGKPSERTVQYGKDDNSGKHGPYIRKDYYENSEEKRLCYLCNMRMAVKKQAYTYKSTYLYMDVCSWCRPPRTETLKHFNSLEGNKIEINRWKAYPFCDKCVDFEWMTGNSMSTIPRKYILPIILLFFGLFLGILRLNYNLKIHSFGEFMRVFINVWKPLE